MCGACLWTDRLGPTTSTQQLTTSLRTCPPPCPVAECSSRWKLRALVSGAALPASVGALLPHKPSRPCHLPTARACSSLPAAQKPLSLLPPASRATSTIAPIPPTISPPRRRRVRRPFCCRRLPQTSMSSMEERGGGSVWGYRVVPCWVPHCPAFRPACCRSGTEGGGWRQF